MQVVMYHDNCNDGLFAAYEVWRKEPKNTLCIPITYNRFNKQNTEQFVTDITDVLFNKAKKFSCWSGTKEEYKKAISKTRLYMVDIIVDPSKLRTMSELFHDVIVLDHHKTARDLYTETFKKHIIEKGDDVFITPFPKTMVAFSSELSGARFTFETLNPGVSVPYYIQLVSDYDTWKKELPESDAFAAGIRGIEPKSMQELHDLLQNGWEEIVRIGEYFDNNRHVRSRLVNKKAIEIEVIHGDKTYKAGIVNTTLDISSITGNLMVTESGFDIGMSYVIVGENEVGWSIRSEKPMDCSFVSLFYGGGGHEQASGFSTNLEELFKIITTRKIVIS